jgi:hypothetical protein
MQIENIVAKVFNDEGIETDTITTEQVVIEALCTYRDKLITSSDEYGVLDARSTKLMILSQAIHDVWQKMPVK